MPSVSLFYLKGPADFGELNHAKREYAPTGVGVDPGEPPFARCKSRGPITLI